MKHSFNSTKAVLCTLDGSHIHFPKSKRGHACVSFVNNVLKLYPKFVKNKFSNLVMGNKSWIQFLEFQREDSTKRAKYVM